MFIIQMLLAVGFSLFITSFVGKATKVFGKSMEPMLHDGDVLIVDRLSDKFREPRKYEIIVFKFKGKNDTYYIRRIIGLLGEIVQIKGGEVSINNKKLEEKFGKDLTNYSGLASKALQLGDDECFIFRDNRNNSSDSRVKEVGIINKKDFIGRAWKRIWPFDNIGDVADE